MLFLKRVLVSACVAAAGLAGTLGSSSVHADEASVVVRTAQELLAAIEDARPGDRILLADGTYRINRKRIGVRNAGTAAAPITVTAARVGAARIELGGLEGFVVAAPHWTFENLDIEGVCKRHSRCEHAFHIKAGGDYTTIRNSRLHEFNAMIKGSRKSDGAAANDVLIEGNEFFNSTIRRTRNPVTFIDVVGGDRWTVRSNLIADFGKARGNRVSYGAFLKGGATAGVFERNLVICERDHAGGTRVGLSFGGGGTDVVALEHDRGVIRNNIIMNCDDVGIYLNRAGSTKVHNNTLFNTLGIDVRFPASFADIRNNLLTGRIKNRNGGRSMRANNLVVNKRKFARWFADPTAINDPLAEAGTVIDGGDATVDVFEDYCGNVRHADAPDIGAIEYDAATPCTIRCTTRSQAARATAP